MITGINTEEEFTYFFTSRERKHPNGSRTDRVTRDGKGYWKMTSKITNEYADKNAISSYLTSWIMHEFELAHKKVDSSSTSSCQSHQEKPIRTY